MAITDRPAVDEVVHMVWHARHSGFCRQRNCRGSNQSATPARGRDASGVTMKQSLSSLRQRIDPMRECRFSCSWRHVANGGHPCLNSRSRTFPQTMNLPRTLPVRSQCPLEHVRRAPIAEVICLVSSHLFSDSTRPQCDGGGTKSRTQRVGY